MKRLFIYLIPLLFLFACNMGETQTDEETVDVEALQQAADSQLEAVSTEIEESAQALEKESQEVEAELDNLIENL